MKWNSLENIRISMYDVKDQFKQYVYRNSELAFIEGDRARDAVQTKEQLEERQTYMRSKFIEGIGGLPAFDTPLQPQMTGIVECEGFRIEKIIFQSRPQNFVTANLYVPDGVISPSGAVIFVCGHSDAAKQYPVYQKVCQYLVKAGLIVLAVDPIGQGERFSYYDPVTKTATVGPCTEEHSYAGDQCWPLGDGIARYFVHDIMRAVDYLCTRPEVDPARIGITGNSGGGTQTSMAMICDERFAAAAPGTFIMNRQSYLFSGQAQDGEQIWPGMTALGFDHEDILLAMTPRPVLVLAVTEDFFPIEGTRRTVERAKRFWDMYEGNGCLALAEDVSVHGYTEPLAQAAAAFFARHLLGKDVSVADAVVEPLEAFNLWCTKEGQVRAVEPDARAVFEENGDRLAELELERGMFTETERKERALAWLQDKVFASRRADELNPRYLAAAQLVDDETLRVQSVLWRSYDGLFNHGLVFRDAEFENKPLPTTIAIWDGGTSQLQSHIEWLRQTCLSGRNVMVLDVTANGALLPHAINGSGILATHGTLHKLTMDLFWLNDSLAAIRTFDVLRALEMAECLKGGNPVDTRIYAHGSHSIYALLAAALDQKAAAGLELVDSYTSAAEWVRSRHYNKHDRAGTILPGMLRYFDLPDLVAFH